MCIIHLQLGLFDHYANYPIEQGHTWDNDFRAKFGLKIQFFLLSSKNWRGGSFHHG